MQRSTCVNEREVAAQLSVTPATLRKWRLQGRGPEFIRYGRAIRYLAASVESWIASRPKGGEVAAAAEGGNNV